MNRLRAIVFVAVFVVAAPGPAWGQSSAAPTDAEAILRAIQLPFAANDARDVGIPNQEIRDVLSTARERRMHPGDVRDVFRGEIESVKEHGRIDNFGAFVTAKLDQGLRGRALADAIHAEHAARGQGKGSSMGNDAVGGRGKKDVKAKGPSMKHEPGKESDGRENGSEKKSTR